MQQTLLFTLFCVIILTQVVSIGQVSRFKHASKGKNRSMHKSFLQNRNMDVTHNTSSVLKALNIRVDESSVLVRKISRCYGRDTRSHNCRTCIKNCVQPSESLSRASTNFDQIVKKSESFGFLEISSHMCLSSSCKSCIDSCRSSFGRDIYLVRKAPGAKCFTDP